MLVMCDWGCTILVLERLALMMRWTPEVHSREALELYWRLIVLGNRRIGLRYGLMRVVRNGWRRWALPCRCIRHIGQELCNGYCLLGMSSLNCRCLSVSPNRWQDIIGLVYISIRMEVF